MNWINAKEAPPTYDEVVLVAYNNIVTVGYYTDWCKWSVLIDMNHEDCSKFLDDVDFWMPLPEPPHTPRVGWFGFK